MSYLIKLVDRAGFDLGTGYNWGLAVAFSPDGKVLGGRVNEMGGTRMNTAYLWQIIDPKVVSILEISYGEDIFFSADGKWLVTTSGIKYDPVYASAEFALIAARVTKCCTRVTVAAPVVGSGGNTLRATSITTCAKSSGPPTTVVLFL